MWTHTCFLLVSVKRLETHWIAYTRVWSEERRDWIIHGATPRGEKAAAANSRWKWFAAEAAWTTTAAPVYAWRRCDGGANRFLSLLEGLMCPCLVILMCRRKPTLLGNLQGYGANTRPLLIHTQPFNIEKRAGTSCDMLNLFKKKKKGFPAGSWTSCIK